VVTENEETVSRTRSRLFFLLRSVTAFCAVSYIVLYIALALLRIGYPFELEWLEGGCVDQVQRIVEGKKLYVQPSVEFVPLMYGPLYFYVSSAVMKLTGVGFLSLRLVSFLASLGCFALLFAVVFRETRKPFPPVLAAGLFAALFQRSGSWYDLARVDSLFLFLLLLAVYFTRRESRTSLLLAGIFFALAFLTKQTALIISIPILFVLLLTKRHSSLYCIATFVLIAGISVWVLNVIHDGWFFYYFLTLPGRQGIIKSMLLNFWTQDLFLPIPVAFTGCILYLCFEWGQATQGSRLYFFLMAVGMILGAWLSRLNAGGWNNVLMPAYAAISILFSLGVSSIEDFLQRSPGSVAKKALYSLYLLSIVQFAMLFYDPVKQLPTQDDLIAGNRLLAQISQFSGDVYVPHHEYLSTLARKRTFAYAAAIADILQGDPAQARPLRRQITQAILMRRFSAIITDNPGWFGESIRKSYRLQEMIFSSPGVFYPVTGTRSRPNYLYVPRESSD